MISAGEGFVIRHRSGRYYRSELVHFGQRVSYAPGTYAVIHELLSNPFAATLIYSEAPWQRHLGAPEWADVADQFEIVPGPGCACCGQRGGTMTVAHDGAFRCGKHKDRNPCAIDGCTRTRAAGEYLASDVSLCGEHWRRFVPPRSTYRRAINRLFRLAKLAGAGRNDRWPEELERRYWKLWAGLVRRARRYSSDGHLDIDEINRMMGWDS